MVDDQPYHWDASQLPERALPVFAAQLISSAGGLGLCLALCAASYVTRREGAVMMAGFAGYAVLRFILELIRVDEAGQFGTALSISQWVSIVVLACSLAGLIWIYRRPVNPSARATAVT